MYTAVDPYRVLDTRDTGGTQRGSSVTVDTGLLDVAAAAVQITVAGAAGPGYLTVWNGTDARPDTSVLNFQHPDQVTTNFVIVPLDGGAFTIYASETIGIAIDVVGYATAYSPTTPERLIDTRLTGGTPAGSAITVRTGLPAGTPSVAVQLTVADTDEPGYLTAWSGEGTRPEASVLNHRLAGDVEGNFVIVPLAADGTFSVYTLARTGIVVDLMGTLDDYTPIRPQRVLDSRTAGGSAGGSVVRVETNLNPALAAAAVQITVVAGGAGDVVAWDGDGDVPDAPALRAGAAGDIVGDFMIVPLRDGAFSIATSVDAGIVVDVMGFVGTAPNVSYDVPDPDPSALLPADVAIGAAHVTHRYGPHRLNALDVYRGTTGQTLVWFHGGGWEGGDKTLAPDAEMGTFNRVPRLLHAEGWTVVSVNYRLSPQARLEDMVDDVYASLLAVARRAELWHIDLSKLVVGGFSSGAHICGLAVTARNASTFRPPRGLPTVRAILSQDGNMMTSLFAAAVPEGTLDAAGNDLSPRPAIARLLRCPGRAFAACTAQRIAASDIVTYSDASDPPLYLIGATHSVIPFDVQTSTRDLVRAAGQVVVFDGVDTGPEASRLHDVQGLNWAALRAFLESVTR